MLPRVLLDNLSLGNNYVLDVLLTPRINVEPDSKIDKEQRLFYYLLNKYSLTQTNNYISSNQLYEMLFKGTKCTNKHY